MSKLQSINPANNELLGEVEVSSEDEISEKIKNAHSAKKSWKEIGLEKRIAMLRNVTKKLEENKDKLALLATREMGMPIRQSKADAHDAVEFFNWYLDNADTFLGPEEIYSDDERAHTIYREPLGVAAVITPWNFPVSNFVWGAAQSLIAGNTIVYKTSEEVPLFGKLLEEVVNGAGLPEGVFQEIYGGGTVGEFLVNQDINAIAFTGSTAVGKNLYKKAGEKFIKAVMELGGSAPGIVFADANLDEAVDVIYGNRFTNCGQICDGLKRLIVHESVFDEVVTKLKTRLETVKVGDPEDEKTDIGPLIAKRQVDLLERQVKDALDKGAKVIIGGKTPEKGKGAYYLPTILTNLKKDMRVWQEEVFGPVLPIVAFDTEEKAIRMANDTKYGLGAYVFTNDKEKALRTALQVDAGMVGINNTSYMHPGSPFGGYKDSGMGREHGKFGFSELTQVKIVSTPK